MVWALIANQKYKGKVWVGCLRKCCSLLCFGDALQMLGVVASAQRFADMVADAQHAAAAAAKPSCAVNSSSESSSGRGGSSAADTPPSSLPPSGGTTAALNHPTDQQPLHQGSSVQALEKLVGEPSWWFTHAFQHVGLQQLSPVCLHPAVCLQQQEQQLSSAAIAAGLSPAAADEVTQWADSLRQHGLAWSQQVAQGFASHWLQQRQALAAQHTAAAGAAEAAAAGCHAAVDNGPDSSGGSSSSPLVPPQGSTNNSAGSSSDSTGSSSSGSTDSSSDSAGSSCDSAGSSSDSTDSSSDSDSSSSSSISTTLVGTAAAAAVGAAGKAAALEALASSSSGGSAALQLCIQPLLPLLLWQRKWLDKAAQVWKDASASTDRRMRQQQGSKAERTLEQLRLHLPENLRTATDWSGTGRKSRVHDAPCPHCTAEAAAAAAVAAGSSSPNSNSACGITPTSSSGSSGLYGQFPVSWSDPFMMRRLLWDLLGKIKPTAQAWFKKHARMCPHSTSVRFWHMVVMSLARHIWIPSGPWGSSSIAQMQLILPLHARVPRRPSRDFAAVPPNIIRTTHAHQLNVAFARQGQIAQTAALLSLQTLRALDPHAARVQPRPELLYYTPSGFHAAVCKTLMQAVQENPGADRWSLCELPAWHMWWHIGLLAYQLQQQQQQHSQAQQLPEHQSAGSSSCGSSSTSSSTPGRFQDLYLDPNAR